MSRAGGGTSPTLLAVADWFSPLAASAAWSAMVVGATCRRTIPARFGAISPLFNRAPPSTPGGQGCLGRGGVALAWRSLGCSAGHYGRTDRLDRQCGDANCGWRSAAAQLWRGDKLELTAGAGLVKARSRGGNCRGGPEAGGCCSSNSAATPPSNKRFHGEVFRATASRAVRFRRMPWGW